MSWRLGVQKNRKEKSDIMIACTTFPVTSIYCRTGTLA